MLLAYDIVVNEVELHSRYFVYYQAKIYLGKSVKSASVIEGDPKAPF